MEKWVTYQQGGEMFGMSAEAFRQRARRERWRTQPANDGKTLVLLPGDAAVRPRVRTPVQEGSKPGQTPAQTTEYTWTINGLAALLKEQHQEREKLHIEWRAERERADGLQTELVAEKEAKARAEGRAEAEHEAFGQADERANTLQAQLHQAQQQVRELLERKPSPEEAEAILQAQGRLILALPRWLWRYSSAHRRERLNDG
jgi:hypothetical protein